MLWDYIRDFLVEYIFGGYNSDGELFNNTIGYGFIYENNDYVNDDILYNGDLNYKVGDFAGRDMYITIGDWLSTTTTIIIMCIAVVLACLLVRWIWRQVSSAFLLK